MSDADSSELSRTSPRARRQCSGRAAEHASRACAEVSTNAARRPAVERSGLGRGPAGSTRRQGGGASVPHRRQEMLSGPVAGRRDEGSVLPPRRIALQTATSLQSMSAAGEPRRHVARSETAAAAACEGAAERGGAGPAGGSLPGQATCRALRATLSSARPERHPRRSARSSRAMAVAAAPTAPSRVAQPHTHASARRPPLKEAGW